MSKTVIQMAKEAGFPFNKFGLLQGDDSGEIDADEMLKHLVELVRADERAKLAEQPAQQEIDWKDQYEKQKRRADMWVAKYEADIGPLEKAGPVAEQPAPAAREPVAWPIETNNHVEALAKQCGWDNRRHMTPADYQIWCDRMRQFVQLASPQAQPAPAAQQEPIYQCQDSTGKWTDQEKHSYDYNVQHRSATVRVVYTSPQAQPAPAPGYCKHCKDYTVDAPMAEAKLRRQHKANQTMLEALAADVPQVAFGNKAEQPAPAAREPVAQHRDLHSHMMVVAHRAADAASSHGQKPTSQKAFVRAICTAIQADKNLLAKLTPQAQPAREPLTDERIDKAAMKLAECMDYPWAQMPEQGKRSMRSHAKAVIESSDITKGNT